MSKVLSKQRALGVSHLKRSSKMSVSLQFDEKEGEQVVQAAKESGRSVAGFVRYAALRFVESLKGA